MAPTTLTLETLYRPVRAELDAVRSRTDCLWQEALALVHAPPGPADDNEGKLVRPALCLLSAGAVQAGPLADFVRLATAIELIHLGALIHDEVVDGSPLRRGKASLNTLWNDRTAVLGGDYLVARALEMAAAYGSCELMTEVLGAMRQMAAAELVDFGRDVVDVTRQDCIRLAEHKTAALFAATCSLPARFARSRYREQLHRYGLAFGVAFQLIDDILDLSQNEETLGKPACGDLVEGKNTLPVFYMRQAASGDDAARLDRMRGDVLSQDDRAWVGTMLAHTGAETKTKTTARSYVERARIVLDQLPPSPYRDSMAGLTDFVLVRGS